MARPLTDDERTAIEAALRAGQSVGAVAQAMGRGKATVSRVGAGAGVDLERSRVNKAAAARLDYNQENRLGLINKFFDTVGSMIDGLTLKPIEVQQLATALAILIDKRRLEDGEATSRSEVHDDSNRAKLAQRLDELAARRAARVDLESDRRTG